MKVLWHYRAALIINDKVVAVSDYVDFCVDSVLPTKTFKVHWNDKHWLSRELKKLIIENKSSQEATKRNRKTAGAGQTHI